LEGALHSHFKAEGKHLTGEWFQLTEEDLEEFEISWSDCQKQYEKPRTARAQLPKEVIKKIYPPELRLKVPETLKEGLETEAIRRGMSVSNLVRTILTEGLAIFKDQDLAVSRIYDPYNFEEPESEDDW